MDDGITMEGTVFGTAYFTVAIHICVYIYINIRYTEYTYIGHTHTYIYTYNILSHIHKCIMCVFLCFLLLCFYAMFFFFSFVSRCVSLLSPYVTNVKSDWMSKASL